MRFMEIVTAVVISGSLFFTGLDLEAKSDKTEKDFGPAESFTHLTGSLAKADIYQAWTYMPKSWRKDINGVAHMIGQKMPAVVWDKVFVLIGRVGGVIETKAALFLEMTGSRLPDGMSKEDVVSSMQDLGKILKILSKSKISTVKSLQTVDIGDVAEDAGSKIFKHILANKLINASVQEDSAGKVTSFADGLSKVTAKLISENGNKAKIKMFGPDGTTEEINMIKLEGKWFDAEIAADYSMSMPKFKEELSKNLDEMSKNVFMFVGGIAMADGIVTSLENAKTADDLKQAFAGIPGFNPLQFLGGIRPRSQVQEEPVGAKVDLKKIGWAVASSFSDGDKINYDGSFKQFEVSKEIDLSKYVFMVGKGEDFTGSAKKALACEKPDPAKSSLLVVFEDGHVETIKGSFFSVEQLKAALKARK